MAGGDDDFADETATLRSRVRELETMLERHKKDSVEEQKNCAKHMDKSVLQPAEQTHWIAI